MQTKFSTRQQFRLSYCDLNNRGGSARSNVLADVSLTGLAPVLRNPVAMHFFKQYVNRNVAALNLRNPEDFRTRSYAIRLLKQLRGVYCQEMPKGVVARILFVKDFVRQLR